MKYIILFIMLVGFGCAEQTRTRERVNAPALGKYLGKTISSIHASQSTITIIFTEGPPLHVYANKYVIDMNIVP